jgi:bidirectional [NiFe] hydrogenase diaphorase subunit
VLRARRGVMELLLARAPGSRSLREMAEKMGVTETRFPSVTKGEADCILCGLCVSVCREVMGAAAISFVGRGQDRKVAPPFYESSEACLGCGACAAVCPVGAIEIRWDDEMELAPFGNRPRVVRCQECGAPIAGQGMGERVKEHLGETLGRAVNLCAACKRAAAAAAAKKAEAAGSSWSVVRKEKGSDG